jgi:glycosyltransferase involved in cell wall biosynthesis
MAENETKRPLRISFLATYVPKQCGIATFAHDLVTATAKLAGYQPGKGNEIQVLAVSDTPGAYAYGPEVRFELQQQKKTDYRDAADFLNVAPINAVSVQHEFGIYGGQDGAFILTLLGNLKKPVVTTLHTLLQDPSDGQKQTLRAVCSLSTLVVVLAERARKMLREIYGVPDRKIRFVHHGVPDVPFVDSAFYKDQFGVEGRRVLLTFGLLNPNKGIEVAIDALSEIVKDFPDVVYFVLGATHPEVKKHYGESYLVSLEQRAKEKGLAKNVVFHNLYVTLEELSQFLLVSDVYLAPYWSREQIVSGTLAYSLGCGKAVVSTPSWYAEEMLAEERGVLVPFGDSHALAEELRLLLSDEVRRNQLRKRAYLFGRQMVWKEVARRYMETFEEAISGYADLVPRAAVHEHGPLRATLPEVRLDHLRVMTDDTGILRHCTFATPNRRYGYFTEDNAAALMVVMQNWRLFKNSAVMPLCQIYLSFLQDALDEETGWFRKHLAYGRQWSDEPPSEDCQGRVLWALGSAVAYPPNGSVLGLASRLFDAALKPVTKMTSPRAWAFALLGLNTYLQRFGGAMAVQGHRLRLARKLLESFAAKRRERWQWCEDSISSVSAKVPHSLIKSGRFLSDDALIQQGLRTLEWLFELQTDEKSGHLSLIGSEGGYTQGGEKARFDQLPMEASALIEAAREAYLATWERNWVDRIHMCLNWFLGINDLQQSLYDFTTGGCQDGLHSSGTNLNEGAESTIAWLLALHSIQLIESAGRLWTPGPEEQVAAEAPAGVDR